MSEIFAAFESVDIRVGVIVEETPNEKARLPAYRMRVDFVPEVGIKQCSGQYPATYSAQQLVGRQVICAMNGGARRARRLQVRSADARSARCGGQCCIAYDRARCATRKQDLLELTD